MNIQGLLGKLARGVSGIPEKLMPTPPYVEGLLSKEDVGSARRTGLLGMGASLLTPGSSPMDAFQAAQGAYGSQMGNTMSMRSMAEERAGAARKGEAMAAMRQKYPTPPKSPDEARQMAIDFSMAGIPLEGGVSEMIKSWQNPEAPKPVTVSPGGTLVNPTDGSVVYQAPFAPRDNSAQSGVNDQRIFTRENTLAGAFNKEVLPLQKLNETVLMPALKTAQAAKAGNGPAQVELLYSFVRALDPESVVREGEVALVNRARSLRQQAEALIQKGQGDATVVPATMVRQMADLIEQRARNMDRYVADRRRYYEGRARRAGISNTDGLFEEFVPNFGGGAGGADFSDVRSGSSGASRVRSAIGGRP